MTVYVVMAHWPYEDRRPYGVYSTQEQAEAARLAVVAEEGDTGAEVSVYAVEVDAEPDDVVWKADQ